ncbi:MAG: glucose-6-phosphate dehydrogenase [Armatimonadota bacterium]
MSSYEIPDNPLKEGLRLEHKPEPVIFVMFGGSGDLARRKIMPSIYKLAAQGLLPNGFAIITMASTKRPREEYQGMMRKAVEQYYPGNVDAEIWRSIEYRMYYITSKFDNDAGYKELSDLLNKLREKPETSGNIIYYLATQPSFYTDIITHIGESGLSKPKHQNERRPRIVIEKPFGHDKQSARELNSLLLSVFDESDIYRVDHYLGKETVQNILVLRFANAIFEPIWNRHYIDHVQITASENIGIEGRGEYYEETGALRDMIQNHMLQLLSLVAMEPPVNLDADSIRNEKMKVFSAIRPIPVDEVDSYVVRGQYGPGTVSGEQVKGYRQEEEVAPDSNVETFVAAKFHVDNWRWQDVPFYIRTGKRLTRKKTEIAIQFKPVPHYFFEPTPVLKPAPNTLVMRIQPDEGASLKIETKLPGAVVRLRSVDMDFRYLYSLGAVPSESYEKLLLDCMSGDQTLFARRDSIEMQWSVVDSILQSWEISPPPQFPNYRADTWGPTAAIKMMERDNRKWRKL